MNAKKIMGAVLVALLAAALFVGAGAASGTTVNVGTVFVYQDVSSTSLVDPANFTSVWTAGEAIVTINNGIVMPNDKFVPGTYTQGLYELYVTYPTASYLAIANSSGEEYIVQNTVYKGNQINVSVESLTALVGISDVMVQYENQQPTVAAVQADGTYSFSTEKPGSYKVFAKFADANLSSGINSKYLYDTINGLNFKVVKSDDVTLSASVDTVLIGGVFTMEVAGTPGQVFTIAADSGNFTVSGSDVLSPNNVTIPNNGLATVYVAVESDTDAGNYEITVTQIGDSTNDASIDIEVIEGTVTAKAEQSSYYIGNDIKLNGTTTAGNSLYIYIAGTNFKFKNLTTSVDVDTVADTWEAKIKATEFVDAAGKKPDAGTYAIYVSTIPGLTNVNDLDDAGVYATTTVSLIQPFISLTSAPEVIVQGDVAKFTGTAEATDKVAYYIFGTNYFAANNATPVKEGEFTVKLEKDATMEMAAGQYFAVFQHMMYDGKFNIWANDTSGKVYYAPTTSDGTLDTAKVIFNVNDRQTANAAQALCDALDNQDIDDMYVKASFIVAAGTSIINPIPEEITKGSELTISGTTTGHVGDIVTVEMLSTAFAAVPKETVGSASFIALTTKVAEDGTWEVTFDTSGLNVDEYTVSVAVGALDGATTTKINVVEGAETPDTPDTPDVPDTPDTPTEPETPGFGALAALAGLGAVAVLLLRRE